MLSEAKGWLGERGDRLTADERDASSNVTVGIFAVGARAKVEQSTESQGRARRAGILAGAD